MTVTPGSENDDDVFGDVFGSEREDRGGPLETVETVEKPDSEAEQRARDERGRFAAKPEQQEPAPQADPVTDPQTPPVQDPTESRRVPLAELQAERKKRQEIERLHIEAQARAKALEELMQQSRHQQPPQVQQEVEEPDPYTDPQGWAQHQRNQVQEMIRQNRAAMSQRFAVAQYGAEAVQAALASVPNHVANGFYANSADPFGDLMEWHKEQQVRKEVGTDLDGFKKRIEDEVRQKVLAELKAGGANGQPQPRFPGSLANATATGAQGAVLTDEAMMGDVFSSSRDRRK